MRFYVGLAVALACPIIALVAVLYILEHGFAGYLTIFAVLAGIGLLADFDRRRRPMDGMSQEEGEALSFGNLAVATRTATPRLVQAVGSDLLGTAAAMAALAGIAVLATWVSYLSASAHPAARGQSPSAAAATLSLPAGIAVDGKGYVYLTDESHLRVDRLSPSGRLTARWADGGKIGGFNWPVRLALGPGHRLYVSDARAGTIEVFSTRGKYLASWQTPRPLDEPVGLALDRHGDLYVTLAGADRVEKLSPQGRLLASFGGFGDAPGQFNQPTGIAVDRSGNIYVLDTLNNRVQKFSPSLRPLASWGHMQDNAPGDFAHPAGITIDSQGNVYVADTDNDRIEKFSPNGKLLATWGRYGHGNGFLDSPHGIAVDGSGNIFVADTFNHRIVKLDATGHVLTTYLATSWATSAERGKIARIAVRKHASRPNRAVPPPVAWFHVFVP